VIKFPYRFSHHPALSPLNGGRGTRCSYAIVTRNVRKVIQTRDARKRHALLSNHAWETEGEGGKAANDNADEDANGIALFPFQDLKNAPARRNDEHRHEHVGSDFMRTTFYADHALLFMPSL